MSNIYDQTVPYFIKFMKNFSAVLDKAEKWADENGKSHEEMIQYRLAPDMRPLDYQVHSLCNTVVMGFERLIDKEHIVVEDNEHTFEELRGRLATAIAWLEENIKPELLEHAHRQEIIMQTQRMGAFKFETGQDYVSEYMIANTHFHFSVGYCLLRIQGVPLSAFDYMKDVFHKMG